MPEIRYLPERTRGSRAVSIGDTFFGVERDADVRVTKRTRAGHAVRAYVRPVVGPPRVLTPRGEVIVPPELRAEVLRRVFGIAPQPVTPTPLGLRPGERFRDLPGAERLAIHRLRRKERGG